MISLFGKHVRKWLLGLALAAQDRVRAVITVLESVEEEKAKDADREPAPSAAKTAHHGGPPAHWVRLVKRNAPELLRPGFPFVVLEPPPEVSGTIAGMDGSSPKDTRDQRPADGAPDTEDASTYGNPSFSLKSPHILKESDDPGNKYRRPVQEDKRQTGNSFRSTGSAAQPPKHPWGDLATHTPAATRPGSDKVHRSPVSPAGVEKTTRMRSSSLEREEMSVNTEGQRAGTREEKTPAGHTAAARGSRSAIGEIDKNGAGEKGKNRVQQDSGVNFRPMERSGKRVAQFDSQADNHQAGSRVDTGMQAPGEIKRETGNDSRPGATGSFNGLWPFSAPGLETPALHVKGKGDDLGHINEVRIINGQGKDYPLKDGEKVEEKISLSAELCWPSLPGEKDSQDVGGARFTATWPSLPEEQSADVKSLSNQMALHPSKAESRNIERLRRLDEEQKGTPWSGSHF